VSRTRFAVLIAAASAALTLMLLATLPVVRWSVTLLALWLALAAGLACRAAWRAGAARWSWRLACGLLRAGRGGAREVGVRHVAASARSVAVAVLAVDRRVVVERCRRLSPGARLALLGLALFVALLAASAGLVVGAVWCARRGWGALRRARAVAGRARSRLEVGLASTPDSARWRVS